MKLLGDSIRFPLILIPAANGPVDGLVPWIERHDVLVWWLAATSAAIAIGMLIATPWLVAMIPDDYFATKERPPIVGRSEHPVLRWLLRIGKNLLGLVLIIFGLLLSLPNHMNM